MKFEDMKNEIPKTPEFIHTMIQNEVRKQLQDAKEVSMQKKRTGKWPRAKAAAAAACVLLASTTAYAGARLYHMYLEKQGTYGISAGVAADGNAGETGIPEKIHDIDISAGYIPEGMEWVDESHLEYPQDGRRGGFSFASALLDEGGLSRAIQEQNVADSEKRTFGRYEGIYLKYHSFTEDAFNQKIYLLCPDFYRVITIFIGDDISKEEAVEVAENLAITENDTMLETAGMAAWSETVSPEAEPGESSSAFVSDDKLPMHQIGEAFDLAAYGEDDGGRFAADNPILARVDAVRVEDDLRLLDENKIPEEWAGAVGADGKLAENTLSYIKNGDGINSVDQIVKTESVKQKLVHATVTYTNKSDREIKHMPYIGTLTLMNHQDGGYQIFDPAEPSGDGSYDRIIWDGVARTAEMAYKSVSDSYGDGGNYIPSLKPGESVQVDMAWIVNENDLAHMYLNLDGQGGAYGFSSTMLKTGLVDIRK